jgi:hypothetical protein
VVASEPDVSVVTDTQGTADPDGFPENAQVNPTDTDTQSGDIEATGPTSLRMMVSTLAFPQADENGNVPGFDLDDSLSTGVEKACGQSDFVDAAGNGGIDNQVSILTPLFDLVGVGQIHQYLQESIDSSGFFLMFDVSGIDSLEDDPEVSLVFEVGGGAGVMGRNGGLVPNQTMCVQEDSPSTNAEAAWIEAGVLHARFSELTILVSRFERVYPITLRGAMYSADISALQTEGATGVVGGGVSMAELMSLVVKMAQNQSNLVETVEPLLAGMGDLPVGDEACGAMSLGLVFDAIPVFFYPPEVKCDPCGNGVCDTFESCETCFADCCPGCGNGMCDVYETGTSDVVITESGFGPGVSEHLVGDKLVWQNKTGAIVNLVCDDLFTSVQVADGATHEHTLQGSGTFTCKTYEIVGETMTIQVADNHTEDCQSCPQDCGECD